MAKVHIITFLISCECLSVNSTHSSCCPWTVSCDSYKENRVFGNRIYFLSSGGKAQDWPRDKSLIILRLALFWSLGRGQKRNTLKQYLPSNSPQNLQWQECRLISRLLSLNPGCLRLKANQENLQLPDESCLAPGLLDPIGLLGTVLTAVSSSLDH